jgi:hypothetical protein
MEADWKYLKELSLSIKIIKKMEVKSEKQVANGSLRQNGSFFRL